MQTKRDFLRRIFHIWCRIYKIRFDEVDVYSNGGHWYGQTYVMEGWNDYDTRLTGRWLLRYKENGDKIADFSAKLVKDYTKGEK